jgi:hypothetical protein
MQTLRDNATRIKRFRELRATLRTDRDRLLVGIDVAKAQCIAQVQFAHTRVPHYRTSPLTVAYDEIRPFPTSNCHLASCLFITEKRARSSRR